jgi:hypothetical protein
MQMKMKAEEVMTTTSMNKKMVNNDKNISTVVNVLLSLLLEIIYDWFPQFL